MKFIKIALATVAISTFTTAAQAQDSNVYVNVGVDAVELDAFAITGRVGYQFNQYFSVEGQGSFGIIDDSDDDLGLDINADYLIGGFVRGAYPITDQFSVFARGGYHFSQLGVDADGFNDSFDFDFDGFAFGGGIEYIFDGKNGVRLDATFLDADIDEDGFEASGTLETYSIAYVRKF